MVAGQPFALNDSNAVGHPPETLKVPTTYRQGFRPTTYRWKP